MRIQVVTTWFPSATRPTEAPFNLEHVKAIAREHDVRVLHVELGRTGPPREEVYEGIRVRRVGAGPRRPLSLLRGLAAVLDAVRDAQIVHTMAFSSALVVAPSSVLRRRPWVHTEHWNGVSSPDSVGRGWRAVSALRYVLRLPDHLTGVTSELAEVLGRFGRPSDVSVVPCVVPNTRPVAAFPPGPPLRLVAVGALIERKRPLVAVETVARLVAMGHDVVLEWIGDGVQRPEVQRRIADLGLEDRVVLRGSLPPQQVFARFDEAHLFFLPTAQENFFTSAAEALSAGRPVVATRVGGYSDYADESNSVLVDSARPEDLARAVLRARERFGQVRPHDLADPIRRRFSPEAVAATFSAIYTDVVSRSRRS